jgi:hypothetical protein
VLPGSFASSFMSDAGIFGQDGSGLSN